jgi:acyl-CoA reductase-like NAD-dependent aldehyde dehydrogenase
LECLAWFIALPTKEVVGVFVRFSRHLTVNVFASVKTTTAADYEKVMQTATEAFKTFKTMPAPQRGNCASVWRKIA